MIAFVVGHHENGKGAKSSHLGVSEWDFYKEVAYLLTSDVDIYFHNPLNRSYTSRIKETANKLNKRNYKLVIEAHFNAATPAANGVETLYYFESKIGKQYAQLFSTVVNQWTGIKMRNRGLKALTNKNDRGFASVFYPKAPAILIEPFFGSNKTDCELIEGAEKMACIIDDFISRIS